MISKKGVILGQGRKRLHESFLEGSEYGYVGPVILENQLMPFHVVVSVSIEKRRCVLMRRLTNRSFVSMILTAFLLTIVFGSIGAYAKDEVVLEFWHYWDGNNAKAVEEFAATYSKLNPNVKVKPIFVPTGELLPKMEATAAAGKPPAIAIADIAWMGRLLRSDFLLPMDAYIEKEGFDLRDFYPSLLEYSTHEGQTLALPITTNNLALFYNKDLFKAAGLDPDRPPATWDELVEYGKKLTKADGSVFGFEMYSQVDETGEGLTWNLQPYLWQAGADFLTDNYSRPGFNNEKGEKALQFVVDLFQKDKVAGLARKDSFGMGRAAMVVNGPWMIGIWEDSVSFEFGTAPIPYPEWGKPATNMGGEQIFIFKTDAAREAAAVDFLMWLTSTENMIKWDKETGALPVKASVANSPEYRGFVEDTEPRLLVFVDQQRYAHARPPVPEYADCSLAFAKEMEKAYYGRLSVKEALVNAEKALIDILEMSR